MRRSTLVRCPCACVYPYTLCTHALKGQHHTRISPSVFCERVCVICVHCTCVHGERRRKREATYSRLVFLFIRACPYRLVTPLVSSVTLLARSLIGYSSRPRSLAHSSFQFASESKGLIKSLQTGFSGISRVNAKESQADLCAPGAPLFVYSLPLYYHDSLNHSDRSSPL